jgi:hypothetical protein
MTRVEEHHYSGIAEDVVGRAKGEAFRNALRCRYVMDLSVGNTR